MCGFVGIFRDALGDRDRAMVERMLEPLAHRGPDGGGTWSDGSLALGHLRLSILDLSERARQPMTSASGSAVLAYNGEVYNYLELRSELEREGVVFKSTGDTEVVLEALAAWGPERAIPRFNGMFAFAYYDHVTRALWLARDRLGIKPLFIAHAGSALLFASDPRALLAHPDVPCLPDRLAVASFVLRGRPDPRITLFEGIHAIEPGWWWRIDQGGISRHRWFHVLDNLDVARLVAENPDDAVDRFEHSLDRSIRLHLASDVPLATICSGGVDSSLVTAIARRYHPELTSYVADLPFAKGEGDTAQRAADSVGVPLTRVPVDRETYLRHWPEAVLHEGHPCFHRSNVALLPLVRRCRRDGVKVLLNGEGADELFGGYRWQEIAFRTHHWRDRLERVLTLNPRRRRSQQDRLRARRFMAVPGIEWEGGAALATVDGDGALRRRALLEALSPVRSRADREFLSRCLDDLYYSLDTLLRRHDRMSMAASVEMRVPFVENGLIDLGMHLPRRVKFHQGQSKWVVKKAAEKRLPAAIVHAPKRAFPVPAAFDQGTEEMLRGGAAGDLLHWTDSMQVAMVDAAGADPQLRFILVGLELWARLAFRRERHEQLADELLASADGRRVESRAQTPVGPA